MENEQRETYELDLTLLKADQTALRLAGKVKCEDIITIHFDPTGTGTYTVINLEGPDSWTGEHETKLGAIIEYLKARLDVKDSTSNEPALAVQHTSLQVSAWARIADVLFAGLQTDGAHHKQWALCQIAELLGLTHLLADVEDRGIAP